MKSLSKYCIFSGQQYVLFMFLTAFKNSPEPVDYKQKHNTSRNDTDGRLIYNSIVE